MVKKLTLSAVLLATGLVLPLFTGQIQQIGNMLLPMHLPVLLCGLICGWQYGGIIGLIMPIMRYFIFGMPAMPNAISMAFELATYGLVVGFLYHHCRWKCIVSLYRSMIVAMFTGRIVWGIAQTIILGMSGTQFTLQLFIAGAFLNAIPGIILQLTLIPAIMIALNRTGLILFNQKNQASKA